MSSDNDSLSRTGSLKRHRENDFLPEVHPEEYPGSDFDEFCAALESIEGSIEQSGALFSKGSQEDSETWFISRTPQDALEWICKNSNRKDVLRVLRTCYTSTKKQKQNPSAAEDVQHNKEKSLRSGRLQAETEEIIAIALHAGGHIAMQEWKMVVCAWRNASAGGKTVFDDCAPKALSLDEFSASSQDVSSVHPTSPIQNLKFLYTAALDTEGHTIAHKQRHRWYLALLYKQIEDRVEHLSSQRLTTPGSVGVGYKTEVLDDIFSELYEDKLNIPTASIKRASFKKESNEFDRVRALGKRWFLLERRFGLGIFVMMSTSQVSNTWLYRLTKAHFDMLIMYMENSNPELMDMNKAVRQWFKDLLSGNAPPLERFSFEKIDNLESCTRSNLKYCFTLGGDAVDPKSTEIVYNSQKN